MKLYDLDNYNEILQNLISFNNKRFKFYDDKINNEKNKVKNKYFYSMIINC